MCWSCAMTLLKVLLVLHAFSRAARISWVRSLWLSDNVPESIEQFSAFISNHMPVSTQTLPNRGSHTFDFWFGKSSLCCIVLGFFSFLTKTLKFQWKSSMDVSNLTLDINASFSRKRNLPFFWSQHINPWGAWRQLHWLETSVPLISPRPPEPVQANGRLPNATLTFDTYAHPSLKAPKLIQLLMKRWHEQNYIGTPPIRALHYHCHREVFLVLVLFLSIVRRVTCLVSMSSYFGVFFEYFKCHLTVYVVSRGLL